MSRPHGSKNKPKHPPEIAMSNTERMEYVAQLLLEIAEDEFKQNEADNATAAE